MWLLKAPPPYERPQELLDAIWTSWLASGGDAMATPELVRYASRRIDQHFGL